MGFFLNHRDTEWLFMANRKVDESFVSIIADSTQSTTIIKLLGGWGVWRTRSKYDLRR